MDTGQITRALKWARANPLRAAWLIPGYAAFVLIACAFFGPPAALLLFFIPMFTAGLYGLGWLLFSEIL